MIERHCTEDGLFQLWASGMGRDLEYPTLKLKSILLAISGKFSELPVVFERMREICKNSLNAEEHITAIEKRFYVG